MGMMSRRLKQQTGGIAEIFIIFGDLRQRAWNISGLPSLDERHHTQGSQRWSGTLVCLVSMHKCKKKKNVVMHKM